MFPWWLLKIDYSHLRLHEQTPDVRMNPFVEYILKILFALVALICGGICLYCDYLLISNIIFKM